MGLLASTDSIAGSSSIRMKPQLFSGIHWLPIVALLIIAFVSMPALAQSGRNTEKKPAPVKRRSVSEPGTEPGQSSGTPKTPANDSRPRTVSDEVDPADTVRVSSNLVPIPASVLDAKGFAISGLKLEDFELRVDGQLRPISELTRTESSVRLVMLFDNSGSVDFARE